MIEVSSDKQKALEAGWEALEEREPNIAGFEFGGFDVKAFKDGQTTIGMLLTKGPEIHVAVINKYRKRWLSRRLIKEVLGGVLNEYGYAVTSVMTDNTIGQKFVKRLGFKTEFTSGNKIHYRMSL